MDPNAPPPDPWMHAVTCAGTVLGIWADAPIEADPVSIVLLARAPSGVVCASEMAEEQVIRLLIEQAAWFLDGQPAQLRAEMVKLLERRPS